MKNKLRIIILVMSLVFLMCCTTGVFLLVIAPTKRLQNDYNSFVKLDNALLCLQSEAYKTRLKPYSTQASTITTALSAVLEELDHADVTSFIKKRSQAVSDSVADISLLRKKLKTDTDSVLSLYRAAQTVTNGADDDAFISAIQSLSVDIDSGRTLVAKAVPVVTRAINTYRIVSFFVSGAIIVATWLLGLLAVWFLARSVRKKDRQIVGFLDALSKDDGEISGTNHSVNASETSLGRLKQFVSNLTRVKDTLRKQVSEDIESTSKLSESLGNTTATFEVVDGFISNIRNEVVVLEDQVKVVKTGLERITSGLGRLDASTVNQKVVVEGSMTSVSGMIASISEMAESAARDEKIVADLVASSERGQSLFSSTYRKITAISESVSRINGMATVIENIAEQTNMLALNAAIEAAHAGESGKGFAVVAEEITKLAEASSESSREIGESIEEIVENITAMASSSGELDSAFDTMTGSIAVVYRTITQFSEGLIESDKNSKQVFETMNTLQDVSNGVTRDSATMSEGADAIAKSMSELDMISSRVFDGITAMSLMLAGLKDAIAEFQQHAEAMKNSGLAMSEELSQLK